jgi:hypothetical protein
VRLPALLAAGAALAAGPGGDPGVVYVDSSLELEGRLLDHRFLELEPGGPPTLVLAVGLAGGRRELRLHPLGRRGFAAEPERTIEVLEDVVAYSFADVRDEPGRELLFLTRSGAWSYSLRKDGYRDNIARLVELDLLYDVPDTRDLPFWEYVLPSGGGDVVILPARAGFVLCAPRPAGAEGAAAYVASSVFADAVQPERPESVSTSEESSTSVSIGSNGVTTFTTTRSGLFLGDGERLGAGLLRSDHSYRAPALVDVDGDGRRDLLLIEPPPSTATEGEASRRRLRVHLGRATGFAREPDRVEVFPPYLSGSANRRLELVDLDGDADPDVLVRTEEETDDYANAEHRVLVLLNDGTRLLPDEPHQVLRFEGAGITVEVSDVDADDRPDLVVRKFEMPSFLQAVTGLEFRMTHLLFLGERGRRPFARKPALKHEERFDETTVSEMIANRHLELDCDGDGRPDLVEVDLQGRVAIRRLGVEKSFFGGERWVLDEAPWQRFEARGSIESLEVLDVNDDGLADIVSAGGRSLSILLSTRGR